MHGYWIPGAPFPKLVQRNQELHTTLWKHLDMRDFVPARVYIHNHFVDVLKHRPLPDDLAHSRNGLCIVGHFLSFRYFEHMQAHLQTLFCPAPPARARLLQKYGIGTRVDSVSVHIRRNDILHPLNCTIVLGAFYYEAAIRTILSRTKGAALRWVVCSDDMTFVKTHWKDSFGGHLLPSHMPVIFSDESSALDDLYLMSLCTHHIVATSTFSAWGAFLAEPRPDKIIVCPDRMTQPILGFRAPFDLFPKHWTHLPASP